MNAVMFASASDRLLDGLEQRRRKLRMTYGQLARLSGVSVPTLTRTLSGKNANASFTSVMAIARALGVSIDLKEEPASTFLEKAAERKAASLVSMVQGTSGLEAQAISEEHLEAMRRQTVHELLAGSRRKLWG
jgi:transcriptional regulator with XRE-family HTH domain